MPIDPSWEEVIDAAIRAKLLEVHTAIPGKVVSYDAATQTADVLPVVQRVDYNEDDERKLTRLPVIPNVPVQWPRGGGLWFSMPLAAGDHVLLVFSEAAIGHWRASGEVAPPGDLRRHSIGYPIALAGIAPDGGEIPDPGGAGEAVLGGGVLRVGGGAAELVAIASKVSAQLDALRQAVAAAATAEGNASGAGGMQALLNILSAWPLAPGVAATKLKAE